MNHSGVSNNQSLPKRGDVHWFHLILRCSVQSVKIAMATRVSSFTTGLVSCMHLIGICQINILQPEMSRFLVNSCVEAPTQITRVFFMHEVWWVKIDLGKGLVNDICESWIIKITLTRISTAPLSRPTRINQVYSCSGIQSSDLSFRGLNQLTMNIYTIHLWWSMGYRFFIMSTNSKFMFRNNALYCCEGNVPVIGGFPSQLPSNAKLWYFFSILLAWTNCWLKHLIWDIATAKWHKCNFPL